MKAILTLMLILGSFLPIHALDNKDLEHKARQIQVKFRLDPWNIKVRFVTAEEMFKQNQCNCFGQSLIFKKSWTVAIIILDDDGYRFLGWTDPSTFHANQKFAVLHELLHVFMEQAHPEFDEDTEEAAVRQLARVVEHEPELK